MATTHITLSDDALLGEYVRLDEFKGLLEQRVAIGPDLLAMLIKDGQIAQAAPGGHFAVGGVWRTIKDAVGGEHAIRLLLADLKPFPVAKTIAALTKDNVEILCELTVELQVNPERPANVLGLMKNHAAVTKAGVLTRLEPHLGVRVVNAAVKRVDALELRGNTGLQDKLQADAMAEVERIAGDVGLLVRAVTVDFGTNDEEQAQILKRQQEREQETLEREFAILNRSIAREAESSVVQLKTALDVEKVKTATDDELRRMILGSELAFIDARDTGKRVLEMKEIQHQLDKNREERVEGFNAQLEQARHAIEMARTGGQQRDVEMDLSVREAKHQVTVTRIRSELRGVEREIDDADTRQRLALQKLEQLQGQELAEIARQAQIGALGAMQAVELAGEKGHIENEILRGSAAQTWKIEEQKQKADAELAKMQMAKDLSEAQTLAVTAGFSPEVANVLVERARAAGDADKMALMREMVQQAKEAQVSSEAQARHFFDSGMTGTVGVAHGVGMAAAGGGMHVHGHEVDGGLGTVECPGCHNVIPESDRFCRKCGRPMRQ